MRNIAIAFVLAAAACGGSPSGTTPDTTPNPGNVMMTPGTTVAQVDDFTAQAMGGLTVQGNWTANDSSTWTAFGASKGGKFAPMRVLPQVLDTHFTIDLPPMFMGEMVEMWVQRVDTLGNVFGLESNHEVIGPITQPMQEDPCATCSQRQVCLDGACGCEPTEFHDGMSVICDGGPATLRYLPSNCSWDCVRPDGSVDISNMATVSVRARCRIPE